MANQLIYVFIKHLVVVASQERLKEIDKNRHASCEL